MEWRLKIQKSAELARTYYQNTLIKAYERATYMQRPIQVDLYILAHYLIYNQQLKFQSETENTEWKEKIIQFFLSTIDKDTWLPEGCLSIKVLIGLENSGLDYQKTLPVARTYADFITKVWRDEGVGECFSPQINRTYGPAKALPCSGPTAELEAKTGYYHALLGAYSYGRGVKEWWYGKNPMRHIKTPGLNLPFDVSLDGWFDVLPELWVIKTGSIAGQNVVTKRRLKAARKNVINTVKQLRRDDKFGGTVYLSALLYAYFLAEPKPTQHAYDLLSSLMEVQSPDGAIMSSFNLRMAGHNIHATPTYFYILAVDKALESLTGNKSK
ncbi:MAG: hypothetical protein L3J50_07490 [Emcibacter sp.]|nr:hypothetical protein [Emcibacter sp.]